MIPPIPLPPFPRLRGKGGIFFVVFLGGGEAAAQKNRYSSPPPQAAEVLPSDMGISNCRLTTDTTETWLVMTRLSSYYLFWQVQDLAYRCKALALVLLLICVCIFPESCYHTESYRYPILA